MAESDMRQEKCKLTFQIWCHVHHDSNDGGNKVRTNLHLAVKISEGGAASRLVFGAARHFHLKKVDSKTVFMR